MKLPDPTPEELMQKFMQTVPDIHKSSTDTGITTLGAVSTVVIAGVVFGSISPWWLALAIPLSLVAWASEVKYWRKS